MVQRYYPPPHCWWGGIRGYTYQCRSVFRRCMVQRYHPPHCWWGGYTGVYVSMQISVPKVYGPTLLPPPHCWWGGIRGYTYQCRSVFRRCMVQRYYPPLLVGGYTGVYVSMQISVLKVYSPTLLPPPPTAGGGVYGDIRINTDQCSEGVWSNVITPPPLLVGRYTGIYVSMQISVPKVYRPTLLPPPPLLVGGYTGVYVSMQISVPKVYSPTLLPPPHCWWGVYGDIRINADQCSEGVWSNVITPPLLVGGYTGVYVSIQISVPKVYGPTLLHPPPHCWWGGIRGYTYQCRSVFRRCIVQRYYPPPTAGGGGIRGYTYQCRSVFRRCMVQCYYPPPTAGGGVYGDIRINADQCSEGVWSNVITPPPPTAGGGVYGDIRINTDQCSEGVSSNVITPPLLVGGYTGIYVSIQISVPKVYGPTLLPPTAAGGGVYGGIRINADQCSEGV